MKFKLFPSIPDPGFWTGSTGGWRDDWLRGYQMVQGSGDYAQLDALQSNRWAAISVLFTF